MNHSVFGYSVTIIVNYDHHESSACVIENINVFDKFEHKKIILLSYMNALLFRNMSLKSIDLVYTGTLVAL